ncbi:MAG: TSUP family transporter, partial [Flavobacteriales bacterium]
MCLFANKGNFPFHAIPLTYINVIIFFIIALIYSSAGFGGGSLYLAVLSGYDLPVLTTITMGLSCNAIVTLTSSINYVRSGELIWKKAWPLLAGGLPFAIWSSTIKLEGLGYAKVLSICLILAAVAMVFRKTESAIAGIHKNWLFMLTPMIGFVSGLSGIGGGIYLAPFLYLTNYAKPKEIAAMCALFILVNSIAGLLIRQSDVLDVFSQEKMWLLPIA